MQLSKTILLLVFLSGLILLLVESLYGRCTQHIRSQAHWLEQSYGSMDWRFVAAIATVYGVAALHCKHQHYCSISNIVSPNSILLASLSLSLNHFMCVTKFPCMMAHNNTMISLLIGFSFNINIIKRMEHILCHKRQIDQTLNMIFA